MATSVRMQDRPLSILTRFIAGQVGTIATDNFFIGPIRRLQTILQTQDLQPQVRAHPETAYTGPLDAFRRSASELGYRSFWRGTSSAIASSAALQLSSMLMNRLIRDPLDNLVGADAAMENNPLSWRAFGLFSIGASVLGLVTWLPFYPLHLVSVISIADTSKHPLYEDTADGIVKLWNKGRWNALYAGAAVKAAGIVCDRLMQHLMLLSLVRILSLDDEASDPSAFAMFVSTQAMSIISRVLGYPFELISRRIQVQAAYDNPPYTDAIDCARKLTDDWKKPLGLWRGFSQSVVLDFVYTLAQLGTIPVNRAVGAVFGLEENDDADDEEEDLEEDEAPRGRRYAPPPPRGNRRAPIQDDDDDDVDLEDDE